MSYDRVRVELMLTSNERNDMSKQHGRDLGPGAQGDLDAPAPDAQIPATGEVTSVDPAHPDTTDEKE